MAARPEKALPSRRCIGSKDRPERAADTSVASSGAIRRPPSGGFLQPPALRVVAHSLRGQDIGQHTVGPKGRNKVAGEVRNYWIPQGLRTDSLMSRGPGKTMPVADNSTADGRQKNRRAEIIVSGEVIGVKIGK